MDIDVGVGAAVEISIMVGGEANVGIGLEVKVKGGDGVESVVDAERIGVDVGIGLWGCRTNIV